MAFDINSDAHIQLTAKLGKLHKSALPVAVRGTLNDAAFETKQLVPKTASRKFVTRNKNFFRAFSSVQTARGFAVNGMASKVGINPDKGSKVAEGLEKQETGGNIEGRKLIPHDKARVSGSHSKKVRAINRFEKISYVKGKPGSKRGRKANTVAQAIVAAKTKKLMLRKKGGGEGTYFRVRSVGFRGTRNRRVSFRMTPVYHKRNTKISRVAASPFMEPASVMAQKKMPDFYAKQAEKQIKRLLR